MSLMDSWRALRARLLRRWQAWRQRLRGWRLHEREAEPAPPRARAAAACLPAPPRRCVSVVIPALNEAARIAAVIAKVRDDPVTAEVIVVDDSSIDDTAALARQAGAVVITSTMLGKGASMHDGAVAASHELVAYFDGDLGGLRDGLVSELTLPLRDGSADFVKARFGRSGGRVTELTARPMLKVFFPELAAFAQPLGGVIAARRELLRASVFEDGYGVDIGLLIDAHRAGARLAEVEIGQLDNDSQPLADLAAMANEVARVIFNRARAAGRLHVEQIAAMHEAQRQAAASFDYVLSRRRGRQRLLLLSQDGAVSPQHFAHALAAATGAGNALELLRQQRHADAARRCVSCAALFRFVHRSVFERVARELPLRDGVVEFVNRMRRAGFMVGVVGDSWFVAAEIVRRRVFADFALAHTLQFDHDVCNGEVQLNAALQPPAGGSTHAADASISWRHVVRRFREQAGPPGLSEVWVVGHDADDLDLLLEADRAFVVNPERPEVARCADAMRVASFAALLPLVPAAAEAAGD